MAGIGADVLETARMAKPMRNRRFCEKVFTGEEMAYCSHKPLETAAGLFAAKEACVKAAGSGFNGFWPCDVGISHDGQGRPIVNPKGVFKELCDKRHIRLFISISHTKELAIAVAAAETDGEG